MDKKISVIISAFNEENYIGKTLESLIKNDKLFEIIVVCDSCEDKTREIALKYTNKVYDVSFRIISKNRNFGVEKSIGDIIIFLDADTLVSSNYIEEILKASDKNDFGCAKNISEFNNLFSKYIVWLSNNYYKKNIGGNFFIKRDLFEKVKGFNENMKRGEDTDLGERVKSLGSNYAFMEKCFIIPSERRYKEGRYLNTIIKSGINGLIYQFFRNYYNKKIANKFYE